MQMMATISAQLFFQKFDNMHNLGTRTINLVEFTWITQRLVREIPLKRKQN